MHEILDRLFGSRFWALFRKEVNQISHNRQLLVQLLVPPTVFLILFGVALNPTFNDLKVGITDYSHSRYSREFIELFQQTDAFQIDRYYSNQQDMLTDLTRGHLTVAVTIPPTFARDLARHRPTQVQAIFDAVDANTANVASGYLSQLVHDYNVRRSQANLLAQGTGADQSATQANPNNTDDRNSQTSSSTADRNSSSETTSSALNADDLYSPGTPQTSAQQPSPSPSDSASPRSPTSTNPQSNPASSHPNLQQNQVTLETSVFYNPGLEASWFIVPGTIGILMTVLGSQAAASTVVREKEAGTIEQLMMTPASNTQVILAKICPLLVLLTFDAIIALCVAKFVFNIPLRGNILLFLCISILYFFVGISIGIMIATYAKSEQQAQLTTFFVNPPLVLLSGANSPIAAMPTPLQWLTHLDPMRYYIEVCRGILLKGVGLESLWHQVLILCVFAIVLTTLSVRQFRRQLS